MTPTIGLEPISQSDRDSFLAMAANHFRELNPSFVPEADWREHYLEGILTNRRVFLRWIVTEGKRSGFILFGLEDHRFLPRKTGSIYELYVEPESRRLGIGRLCALLAIRELQTHSPSKVQLEIMTGNRAAEALWESLGFRKFSERWVLEQGKR
jgi:ribosomal protein S18 acetylase RimI-like enzyme